MLREKQRRWVGHAAKALVGHREHAELVDRAEAVLNRADQPEAGMRIALEVENRVNDVLEHARAGDPPLVGDMADAEQRPTGALRAPTQLRRALEQTRPRS